MEQLRTRNSITLVRNRGEKGQSSLMDFIPVSSRDLFRSAFQSSNSIGQFIIHDYMGICAVALTTP